MGVFMVTCYTAGLLHVITFIRLSASHGEGPWFMPLGYKPPTRMIIDILQCLFRPASPFQVLQWRAAWF